MVYPLLLTALLFFALGHFIGCMTCEFEHNVHNTRRNRK